MKIVLLGGTFNPPHNGHLRILRTAAQAVQADAALMIPTGISPHKSAQGVASGVDRLAMCRLAAQSIGAQVSDCELRRAGKSYTVLTLEELHAAYASAQLYLTMGADMLVTLDSWYRYADIIKLAHIVAFYRQQTEAARCVAMAEKIKADGGSVLLLPLEPDGISSTEIRNKLAHGQDPSGELPEKVLDYIKSHGLYKSLERGNEHVRKI